MEWSELPQILRLLAALAFVIALMGGLAFILKKTGFAHVPQVSPKKRRLKIVEALPLDSRHRAVLIQRDNTQHLIILGANSEIIVETNITPEDDHAS